MDIAREIARGRSGGHAEADNLAELALFRRVPDNTMASAARCTRWRRHHEGAKIMGLDEDDRTGILVEGLALAHSVTGVRDPAWFLLRPGDAFGVAAVPERLAEAAQVEALTDGAITYQMPRETFETLAHTQVSVAEEIARQMEIHLVEAVETLRDVTGLRNGLSRDGSRGERRHRIGYLSRTPARFRPGHCYTF